MFRISLFWECSSPSALRILQLSLNIKVFKCKDSFWTTWLLLQSGMLCLNSHSVRESLSRTLFHADCVILGSALKKIVSCSQCDFGFCFAKDCFKLSVWFWFCFEEDCFMLSVWFGVLLWRRVFYALSVILGSALEGCGRLSVWVCFQMHLPHSS